MKTESEWVALLETKEFGFLVDQTSVAHHNSTAFRTALYKTISKRQKNGERLAPITRAPPRKEEEEDDDESGRVEIVRCGGKGQTIRIVHPKSNS